MIFRGRKENLLLDILQTHVKTIGFFWSYSYDLIIFDPGPLSILTEEQYFTKIKDKYFNEKNVWQTWQSLLRQALKKNQKNYSLFSNDKLSKNYQLHHAIVTKADVRGLKEATKNLIHHTYNCIVLSPEDHLQGKGADNRKKCINAMSRLYSESALYTWFVEFNDKLKVKLPDHFED